MHAIKKLLNRFPWNFYRKCKSIHPLCLWSFTAIWIEKLCYSQYVEQEQDIFRYVKNSELPREIRCHSDRIFPNLHQCYQWYSAPPPPPPPFELCFVSSHFASVWEFSKMLLLNFGMFAISDCPFIYLLFHSCSVWVLYFVFGDLSLIHRSLYVWDTWYLFVIFIFVDYVLHVLQCDNKLDLNLNLKKGFYGKRHGDIFYSATFMECYFIFEQGMYYTQIRLPIYVDIFGYIMYFRLVRHQYLENCD